MSSFNRSSSSSSKQYHCVRGSNDKLIENVVETVAASAAETAAPIQPKLYSWFVHRTHIHIVTLYQHIWHLTLLLPATQPHVYLRKAQERENSVRVREEHVTKRTELRKKIYIILCIEIRSLRMPSFGWHKHTHLHRYIPLHATYNGEQKMTSSVVLCCAIRRDETLVC